MFRGTSGSSGELFFLAYGLKDSDGLPMKIFDAKPLCRFGSRCAVSDFFGGGF